MVDDLARFFEAQVPRPRVVAKVAARAEGPSLAREHDHLHLAIAFGVAGERAELVVELAVDSVEPEENGLRLISIFGDQKFLKARIHSLSLVDNKVFLSPE